MNVDKEGIEMGDIFILVDRWRHGCYTEVVEVRRKNGYGGESGGGGGRVGRGCNRTGGQDTC